MTETKEHNSSNAEAKAAILASIRRGLAASAPFDGAWREHHSQVDKTSPIVGMVEHALSRPQLLDKFKENLKSVGGHCTIVSNKLLAADAFKSIIQQTGARRIAISDAALVRDIVKRQPGIEYIENGSPGQLFECDLGITSAQWGIAETGTLVLESEKESHRLTSLVPTVHLCVLKADQIRQTLGEILKLTGNDLSRTVTFITGASRTSDIELTLAIGVHGPAELHVIVIDD